MVHLQLEEDTTRVQDAMMIVMMMITMKIELMRGMGIGMMKDMAGGGILMNDMIEMRIEMTTTEVVVMMITSLAQEVGVLMDMQTILLVMMTVTHPGIYSLFLLESQYFAADIVYFSDSSWSWTNLWFKTLLITLNCDSNYDPIIMKFPLDFTEMAVAKLTTSLKMKGN